MESENETKSRFNKLPVCATEYIKQVLKKMRYRRKVTQDVQAELAAHFEDELKDYATDEEKEQKAQQLIAEFGDVKLLAVLLRRAKKRCRPLWRTVVARSFQAVGVLILCFIIYAVWFSTGRPTISFDYLTLLNQMNQPEVRDEDNAWPNYEKAIELYVEASKKLQKSKVFKNYREIRSFAGLTEQEKTQIKEWIEQNKSAWREYVQGSKRPYCYKKAEYNPKDVEKWLLNILLPELGTLRNLSKLGIWRSRTAIEQGRLEEGIENCLAAIRAGKQWKENKWTIVEQLVGIWLSRLGHNEILHIIERQDLSAVKLMFIHEKLSAIYADGYPLMDTKAEKFAFMDVIQHCFTDGGAGGGHLIPEKLEYIMNIMVNVSRIDGKEFGKIPLFTGPAMYHARRDATVKKANQMYELQEEIAEMTPYQRHLNNADAEIEDFLVKNRWRYSLVWFFMPNFSRASEIAFCVKVLHEATLTVLALKRWRLVKGYFPDSLEQLVSAGYLRKLPIDSYSDKPLVYKKTDDNFILYSVGPNFTDDGGVSGKDGRGRARQWMDNGDTVFWPVPQVQSD